MTEKFTLDKFSVKKLDENVDLTCFDCSENDELGLNDFIHKEAADYQKESMGVTHLFYYDNKLVGYVTLAMGTISVKQTRLRLRFWGAKVRYPALLLGRVAVANEFRKRNIGKCMCLWSIGLAEKLSDDVGCRFVVLVTQAQHRVDFYTRCGFHVCSMDEKKETKMMYFQLF